jgi:hypothetical protein
MVFVVILPIVLIPYWRIFSKAGFPSALSLLIVVPFVSLIVPNGNVPSELVVFSNNQ